MPIAGLGAVGLVGAGIASLLLWNHNTSSFGVVLADNFGLFVTWILIVVGLLTLAFSGPTIERERLPGGEYYALVLFALAGMMLMATATDLLVSGWLEGEQVIAGLLALELGWRSEEAVREIVAKAGFHGILVRPDMHGIPRVLTVRR
jgi:methylase of polypeptide subunit release factors